MVPPLLPTRPQSHKRSTFFTRVVLAWAAVLWLFGDRTQSAQKIENGEGMPAPATPLSPPPSSWQASGSSFLRLVSLPGVQGLVGLVSAKDPEGKCFHTK